jgi:2-keto-4-pentenoate hydratase/2-oxohepta-3-ene-1,7-dioic acid hydratase in catechol pathway
MRLVTYRTEIDGDDQWGAFVGPNDAVVELGALLGLPSVLALVEAGQHAWAEARRALKVIHVTKHRADIILRAPIPQPPQYRDAMCFHEHIRQAAPNAAILVARRSGDPARIAAAEEAKRHYELPGIHSEQPVYYKGNRFAVGHPDEDIPWPAYSELMDFELELACVIGRRGRDISPDDALDHVFGFTILNDFSARDAQASEMQGRLGPAKGKDFDKANVFGPCLVTLDEIGDPHKLAMRARVNGQLWCDGSSQTMNWTFRDLLAHISRGETLYPGEIIGSGTVGNGCGLEHLRLLNPGDVVELEIEKIGRLRNRVIRQPSGIKS